MTNAPTISETEQGFSFALKLDLSAYRQMLPLNGMTEAEQTKYLETVWAMMTDFVDVGFDCHPVQLAMAVGNGHRTFIGDVLAVISCTHAFNRKSNNEAAPEDIRAARKKES